MFFTIFLKCVYSKLIFFVTAWNIKCLQLVNYCSLAGLSVEHIQGVYWVAILIMADITSVKLNTNWTRKYKLIFLPYLQNNHFEQLCNSLLYRVSLWVARSLIRFGTKGGNVRPVRSMFFQKLPKLVLFESVAGSECAEVGGLRVWFHGCCSTVCTGDNLSVLLWGLQSRAWRRERRAGGAGAAVGESRDTAELLLCACTEEPVQSCVCSCWVSIFLIFPFWDASVSRPRKWWLSSQAVSEHWGLYLLLYSG